MTEGTASTSEDATYVNKEAAWRQYLCKACGYVYDEKAGDPDSGLPPGTRYEDIPEDWYCPICGVTKSDFVLCTAVSCAAALKASNESIVAGGVPLVSRVRVNSRKHHLHDLLVVGGGMAGWALVEALRSLSSTLTIAMVSDCDATRYDKPLLSVALTKNIGLDALAKESGAEAAERLGVTLFAQTNAIRIDNDRHILRTTRGEIRYRHLVLAYGAKPVLPKGLPPQHCWRINHLDHYVRFRQALESREHPQRVLIIGAGLIGTELADDLARSKHQVTLVDTGAFPLNQLATDRSQVEPLLTAWKALPVRFLSCTTVRAVTSTANGLKVTVEVIPGYEDTIETDHVLVCVGQQVEDRLAQSARLNWANGIDVDPVTLQTSQPGIYAMGDCISIHGRSHRFVEPLRRQACTIASQIAGMDFVRYDHQPVPVRVKTQSFPLTLQC